MSTVIKLELTQEEGDSVVDYMDFGVYSFAKWLQESDDNAVEDRPARELELAAALNTLHKIVEVVCKEE